MDNYPKIESNPNFPQIEKDILEYWAREDIFNISVNSPPKADKAIDKKEFVFYDGPPFANGLPHYGHLLTGYVKDIIPRYHTMLGKRVERRFGWDCHGLPAEMAAEKELKVSGRRQISEFGIDKFNAHCQTSVLKYTKEWEQYVTRQARWVDFKNDYKTMNIDYMESVIWAFKELYSKGLIYESQKVMPYSWACETPLSNFETRMDNSYRQRADKAITVKFEIKGSFKNIEARVYKILAWTTTPWTLPSNLALAVSTSVEYVGLVKNDECLIIGKFALEKYAKELDIENAKIYPIQSQELIGLSYIPLFSYFENHSNSFKILNAEFVQEGEGTGIVHIAPGFGEDDQTLCKEHNIATICPADDSGKFTKEVPDYEGRLVLDANDDIIKRLKQEGYLVKTEQYLHNYPHCWRTDTPLIYKAVSSWFVEVTKIRERMVELNKEVNWIPSHIKDGLFGKWLENAKDWSISRNRFWGTPIPVWRSDDPKYPRIDVYGSIKELEQDFGVKVQDLHKPFIDKLVRPNPDDPTGKSKMVRVSDVFDCWFESGSMPYAQVHYPFENKNWFEQHFPGDFIVEYVAQTRGWFYTLFVLSTALFDRPPFKNALCHGVILDINGQKLSKRLNNYPDPLLLFEQYGADALRFVMASSVVMKGEELLIDKEGNMVREANRLVLKPIWNAYNFFCIYANIDKIKAEISVNSDNTMDLYILAKTKATINAFKINMDQYDTVNACKLIVDFFELLNNWYIRRSRSRFWKSEKDTDKINAYNTLYTVLIFISRMMAPLLPLITEEIYLGLTNNGKKEGKNSIHLTSFPAVDFMQEASELSRIMDKVRDICSTALSIRNKENLRSRLPLASLKIISKEEYSNLAPYFDIIKEEINVKEILCLNNLEDFSTVKLLLNFPLIGKRLPAKMKEIIAESKKGTWKEDNKSIIIAGESLLPEEAKVILEPSFQDGSAVLSSNDALIVLDLRVTEELLHEGIARDFVRAIQQARKDLNLEITDRITLSIESSEECLSIIASHKEYIESQTLSRISFDKLDRSELAQEMKIEDHNIKFSIQHHE
jgi:isoleucyl-tRNA synthetase